jgi:hypothetical protein
MKVKDNSQTFNSSVQSGIMIRANRSICIEKQRSKLSFRVVFRLALEGDPTCSLEQLRFFHLSLYHFSSVAALQ